MDCRFRSGDFARDRFAAKYGSDHRGHESDHLRTLAWIQSGGSGFCPFLDERLLQCGRQQQRLGLRSLSKEFRKDHGLLQAEEEQVQNAADSNQEHRPMEVRLTVRTRWRKRTA